MNEKLTLFDITLKDTIRIVDRDKIGYGRDLTNSKEYTILGIYAETNEVYPSVLIIDDVGEESYILESEFTAVEFVKAVTK